MRVLVLLAVLFAAAPAAEARRATRQPVPPREPVRETVRESAAAENDYWDFRLGFGVEPGVRRSHYEVDAAPDFDADWDEEAGGSLEFNVAHRFSSHGPHSAFVTFGVFARGFESDEDPDTGFNLALGAAGIQGGGGYSYWNGGVWSLEFGPRIGLGGASAKEEYDPTGDEIESDSGGYGRIDLHLGNYLTFERFQVGLTLGVAAWAADVHYDDDVVDFGTGPTYIPETDADYHGSGAFALLSLGWR